MCLISLQCLPKSAANLYFAISYFISHFLNLLLIQIEFSENTPASFSYLSSLLSTLLPASILLLEHKNGDTRVVVTSVLRRLVPSVLHAAVRFSTFFQEAGMCFSIPLCV